MENDLMQVQIEDSGPLPLLDCPHRWLLIKHEEDPQHQTFYNLSERIHHTKNIPELHNKHISDCGDSNGWLYLEDRDSTDCSLLNIATMEKVSLPPLSDGISRVGLGNFFVTVDPNRGPLLYDTIGCSSVTMLDGRIYGLSTGQQELVVCDMGEKPHRFNRVGIEKPHELEDIQEPTSCILVECGGEILLVAKCLVQEVSSPVEVYRADFGLRIWTRVTDIGKHAIFLQNEHRGYSCSTEGLKGVEENCIYFTVDRSPVIHVFFLEGEWYTFIRPYPHLRPLFLNITWVMLPPKPNDQ